MRAASETAREMIARSSIAGSVNGPTFVNAHGRRKDRMFKPGSSFSVHANSGAVRVGATQLRASPATLSVGAAFEFDTSTALPTLRTLGNLHVNGSLHAGGELSADSSNELAQWSLVASDLFSEPVSGWCAPASPHRPPPRLRLTTHHRAHLQVVQPHVDVRRAVADPRRLLPAGGHAGRQDVRAAAGAPRRPRDGALLFHRRVGGDGGHDAPRPRRRVDAAARRARRRLPRRLGLRPRGCARHDRDAHRRVTATRRRRSR